MAAKPFSAVREESLSRGVLRAPVRREALSPEEIVIPPRLRAGVNDATVLSLMEGIRSIGLQTPVTVRIVRDGDEEETVLVAGRHRLEACLRLGIKLMDCSIFEGTEDEARLWEIAENLHRAELTTLERAEHIAEWVKLTGERIGASCTNSPKPGPRGAIRAAERELGIEHTEASRSVKIASISVEAREAARAAGLDNNQSALLAVASAPVERQAAKVADLKAEREAAAVAREERRRQVRDAEDAHKLNRQQDKVIALTEAQQFAEWLMARTDLNEVPMIISWLEGCKSKDVIAAMRREAA